jgi:hypothetical protein
MILKFCVLIMVAFSSSSVKSQTAVVENAKPNDSDLIAFASDTQAPMWVETLWLKANNNRQATKKVFEDIMKKRPGSLYLLGDVVNLGYSNRQWKPIDRYLAGLRNEGVGVHAILGNHEVMGQSMEGQRKFQKRFPDHVRTGYVQIKDSVAIVLLNSNFKKLSKEEVAKQDAWYKATLQALDNDPAIHFIITACHHSPFTNSKIVGSSKDVQEKFVPAFLASKKGKLFLSGHCHGFEHYKIEGKDFMVIGGGGGLHQPLREGDGCLPDVAKDYKPLFHYLTVRRVDDHLEVKSIELKNDFTGFDEGLAFNINGYESTAIAVNTVQANTPASEQVKK